MTPAYPGESRIRKFTSARLLSSERQKREDAGTHFIECPYYLLLLRMMLVIPSVVRRRGVRKYGVVHDIILNHATDIERGRVESLENFRWTGPEVAPDCYYRDP
jgi:hypothetical protein